MSRRLVWLTGLVLVVIGTYLFGLNQGKRFEEYKFIRVVDGDTLMVTNVRDGREIRLRIWGIDAPELNECSGENAKKELDNLFINSDLRLEVVGFDSFGRTVAKIMVKNGDVALLMLETGMAKVDSAVKDHIRAELKPREDYLTILRQAEEKARVASFGVWSKQCLATVKKRDPKCNIKGNYHDGKRYYYLEKCSQYQTVVVQEQAGDKWFCTEEQAKTLGFVLALTCR